MAISKELMSQLHVLQENVADLREYYPINPISSKTAITPDNTPNVSPVKPPMPSSVDITEGTTLTFSDVAKAQDKYVEKSMAMRAAVKRRLF